MKIVVNGTETHVPPGETLASLVSRLGLAPDRIAVERNLAIVRRPDYAATPLSDGDRLEIVTFVGGG